MAKILVGNRLPYGLELNDPLDNDTKVEIKGVNASRIIGATFMTTEVDTEFWESWKAVNGKTFAPYVNGTIFEAGSTEKDAEKALPSEKTGLEPLVPDDPKNGVETLDKK